MPRDNRLFTLFLAIVVCLHIVRLHICMLWLTKIMQKPAAARRALVVELLRRLDQTKNRRYRSHSLPSLRPRFADEIQDCRRQSLIAFRPQPYRVELSTTELQLRLFRQSAVGVTKDGFALEQLATGSSSNSSSPQDVPISSPGVVQREEASTPQHADLTPPISPTAAPVGTSHDAQKPIPELTVHQRPVDSLPQFNFGCTPPLSDHGGSGSDTPSTKGGGSPSPKARKPTIDPENDTVGGANEDEMDSPDRTFVSTTDVFGGPTTPQYHRHWRNFSVDSSSTTIRKSSTVTLRAQSKNNGGLLEFRASATKPNDSKPTGAHRRNRSVNLPIRPILSQPGGSQQNQFQPPASSAQLLAPRLLAPSPDELSITVQAELELEYKHRRIFIGTASLHCFLEILETSSLRSTTKLAVMKAFTTLAWKEQLLYRQSSTNPEDWNLVTRVTHDISNFNCVTMSRVLLGSISLQQFVDYIPFNGHDEAPTVVVVEAFKNASHVNAEESHNMESKARAFRRWLLSQNRAVE